MGELFRNIINASFYGSIAIGAVLLLRLVLKKAPKKYLCLLWALVGLRLLVPFSVESKLSLQPREQAVTESDWQDLRDYGQIFKETAPAATEYVSEEQLIMAKPSEPREVEREFHWAALAPYLWLTVACSMGLYSLISYLRLRRRVRESVKQTGRVWECAGLETAFILGWIKPRIYIPMGLPEMQRQFILAHERAHLKRGDHWIKPIGFIALLIHWFNPLVWVAYILLCRDIEMACDEDVVKNMALEERKAYSAALLSCSAGHRTVAACPVAFGEVSVKQRILGVLHYRKPGFWLSLLAAAAVIFVAVCFLTNPAAEEPDLSFLNYKNAIALAAEQDVLFAVHYGEDTQEGNEVSGVIGIGMVEGKSLAEYLDSADWQEKWFEPSDLSSPGSVAINIAEDLRINVYDRHFASVEYGDEVRYYRIGWNDYQKAVDILLPPDHERIEASSQREFALSGTIGQKLEAFFRNDCPARMAPEEILLLDYDEQFALVFYSGEGPVLKFCRYVQEGEKIRVTGVCEGGYTLSGGMSINCLELDGNYIYFGTVSDSHFDPGDDTVKEFEWSKLRMTDAGGATAELDMAGRQGYFCILGKPLADFQVIDTDHVVCLDYARYTQQGYAIDAVNTWQTE